MSAVLLNDIKNKGANSKFYPIKRTKSSKSLRYRLRMSEEFVKRKIEKWLKENDFPKPQVHKKEKHGVDIKAKHATQGIYYLIEAKGEGKSPSVDEGNLKNALGQIVTRYEVKSYKYAIGLPEDSAKKLKKKVPYLAAKALNLRILSVGPKGNVEEFPPKSFKKPTNS